MKWALRLAQMEDVGALEALISQSVYSILPAHYSPEQLEASMGIVFGVDRQLIGDDTYYVVEHEGQVVGCGGWSKRYSYFGADRDRVDPELNPATDAARVRAFFVHPSWARRGIGRRIMAECERAIVAAGFRTVDIVATLAGEPLYKSFGYAVVEQIEIPLPGELNLPGVRMVKQLNTVISPGKPADLPEVAALKNACLAHLRSQRIQQWDELYPSTAQLDLDIRTGMLHVLRVDGQIAGCMTMDQKQDALWLNMDWTPADGQIAAVHRVMVQPQMQGRGLGKLLMNHAACFAAENGFQAIRLDAFAQNPGALALYDRLGYRRVGTAMMRKGPFICFEKLL